MFSIYHSMLWHLTIITRMYMNPSVNNKIKEIIYLSKAKLY